MMGLIRSVLFPPRVALTLGDRVVWRGRMRRLDVLGALWRVLRGLRVEVGR